MHTSAQADELTTEPTCFFSPPSQAWTYVAYQEPTRQATDEMATVRAREGRLVDKEAAVRAREGRLLDKEADVRAREGRLATNEAAAATTMEFATSCLREAEAVKAAADTQADNARHAEASAEAARQHAEARLAEQVSEREARLEIEDLKTAIDLYSRGQCAQEVQEKNEAVSLFFRSLEIFEARLGPDDLTVARTLCCVVAESIRTKSWGDWSSEKRAEEKYTLSVKRAMEIFEAKFGYEKAIRNVPPMIQYLVDRRERGW